jgi:succinate dehydrogenase flavin-adding protein (antitoxin of CptAB toxin-antitoxin module)
LIFAKLNNEAVCSFKQLIADTDEDFYVIVTDKATPPKVLMKSDFRRHFMVAGATTEDVT